MEDKKIEERYGNEETIVIPRFVWESHNASHERTVKRLIIGWAVSVLLLVAFATAQHFSWQHLFDSYDITSESYTIENEADGNANFLDAGNDGVINNGIESSGEKETND